MPFLVDGDNVLGNWPGRKRSDAERKSLAFELARFGRRIGRRIVVVFDGMAPPGMSLGSGVHFSGAGRSADDVILALLRQERDRRGWHVVTSDRSLGDQCRYLEARVERSDLFRHRISRESDGAEKPEQEDDIAYWLERFEDTGPAEPG